MDYEVILVDDGSADQTSHIIDAMADADPRVMVVHHPTNLGYGAALQSGIRAATKTLVFYPDGDGQFDLNELPPLLPLMKQYDIVSCFRLNRQDGLFRRFNDWCWTNFLSASNCATVWTAVALAQLSRRRIKVFQEAGLVASKRQRRWMTAALLQSLIRQNET